jgi:uncharacterized protein YkwD
MKKVLLHLAAGTILAAILAGSTQLTAPHPALAAGSCDVANADQTLGPVESAMVKAINDYRRTRRLPLLNVSPTLRRAALWKTMDMANGGPYSHADSDGRYTFDRLNDCGYDFANAAKGENLGNISAGAAPDREVQELLAAWRASPLHEEVQTNPDYHVIGIARASGGGSVYWTVTFGSVMDSEAQHALTLAEVRLPSLDEDPCLPDAFSGDCGPERLALWSGDPQAWAVQLGANAVVATPENILLETLYYRSDGGSTVSRDLLVRLGIAP